VTPNFLRGVYLGFDGSKLIEIVSGYLSAEAHGDVCECRRMLGSTRRVGTRKSSEGSSDFVGKGYLLRDMRMLESVGQDTLAKKRFAGSIEDVDCHCNVEYNTVNGDQKYRRTGN